MLIPDRKKIRIIPRLDIKGTNVVKGIHLEGLRVLGLPWAFAHSYYLDGADEIIFMDSVASLYGRNNLHEIVTSVAEQIFIPMTVGGGIRSINDIQKLLKAGADKVAINTALFSNPELLKQGAEYFGSQCMVVQIDVVKNKAKNNYECLTDNGRESTGVELSEWVEKVIDLGAGEILITSVDKEGTGEGYDIDAIRIITETAPIPVIVCGGAGNRQSVLDVIINGNADAVAAASIFHYELVDKLDSYHESSDGNKDFLVRSKNMISENLRRGIEPSSISSLKRFLNNNNVDVRVL